MPLHPLAQDAVKEVSKHIPQDKILDWSIALFPEIRELDSIARRNKRRTDAQDIIDSLDFPLVVGGVSLQKLSVGGNEWLKTYPAKWWGVESENKDLPLLELATVYAMAHRQKEDYSRLVSRFPAKVAIMAWAKELKVAEDVLISAATYLLPQNDPIALLISGVVDESDKSATDIQTYAQKVSERAGIPIHSAIWELPADAFWNFYCDFLDEKENEYNAELKAAKKNVSLETWVGKQKVSLIKARRDLLKKSIEWLKSIGEK